MMNRKNKRVCSIVGTLIFCGFILNAFIVGTRLNFYSLISIPKCAKVVDPIIIIGDSGWVSFRDAGNCSGSGTLVDPYVIEDCIIDAKGGSPCIYIVGSTVHFRIENCTLINAVGGSFGSITLDHTCFGQLFDNNISTNPTGIYLLASNFTSIQENCVVENNWGIVLDEYCQGNVISYNNVTFNDNGITVQDSCMNNQISNNLVSRNYIDGISLFSNSANNSVAYNSVIENDFKGIYLSSNSNNNSILSNDVKDNGESGIWLNFNSNNNTVIGNNASSNGEDGIRIEGSSSNNTIGENKIQNNTLDGIVLVDDCSNNTFIYNYVVGNTGTGANITVGCDGNLFYYNNFSMNCVKNAQDNGTFNRWDNGSIGNYWGDYGGIDNNDDGIGDTPQPVSGEGSIQDNYPIWSDVDEIPPEIQIYAPLNVDAYRSTPPILNVTVIDLSLCDTWYIVGIGLRNYSITPIYFGSIDATAWSSEQDGTVVIQIWANDTVGHFASKDVTVLKDTTAPVVVILEPNNRAFIGADAPKYNVSIAEANMDCRWFEILLSNGTIWSYDLPNYTGVIPQEIWDQVPMGTHRLRVYANDSAGNESHDEVTIIKTTGQIPGYPFEILCLIGVISLYLTLRRFRRRFY